MLLLSLSLLFLLLFKAEGKGQTEASKKPYTVTVSSEVLPLGLHRISF